MPRGSFLHGVTCDSRLATYIRAGERPRKALMAMQIGKPADMRRRLERIQVSGLRKGCGCAVVNTSVKQASSLSPCARKAGTALDTICTEPQT